MIFLFPVNSRILIHFFCCSEVTDWWTQVLGYFYDDTGRWYRSICNNQILIILKRVSYYIIKHYINQGNYKKGTQTHTIYIRHVASICPACYGSGHNGLIPAVTPELTYSINVRNFNIYSMYDLTCISYI